MRQGEVACGVCGSEEKVTRPDGSRRCAYLFSHGAAPVWFPRPSCLAQTNIASLVRGPRGQFQKPDPGSYEYARCYKDAGHDGRHRADVVQRGTVWW